jgi:hypothetical protein
MRDEDWDLLVARIRAEKCTPFLGAGACWPTLPTGKDLARQWAKAHKYPLDDKEDLARVAQYLGVHLDDQVVPKEQIIEHFADLGTPDFTKADEPHMALAKLPVPIYITTNYDDFMEQALRLEGKDPQPEICRWNSHPAVQNAPGVLRDDPDFEPTPRKPLVFHLLGQAPIPESLVLTEDDYLDFLVAVARNEEVLPDRIREAFAGTSLLFIGYSLADWDFRVLHRGLVMTGEAALRRISVTVQLERKDRNARRAREYLEKYFARMAARVYWGDADKFAAELTEKWEAASHVAT